MVQSKEVHRSGNVIGGIVFSRPERLYKNEILYVNVQHVCARILKAGYHQRAQNTIFRARWVPLTIGLWY